MNIRTEIPVTEPADEQSALRLECAERGLVDLHRQLMAALERGESLMSLIGGVPMGTVRQVEGGVQ